MGWLADASWRYYHGIGARPSGCRDVGHGGASGLYVTLGHPGALQPEGCAPMPAGPTRRLVAPPTCASKRPVLTRGGESRRMSRIEIMRTKAILLLAVLTCTLGLTQTFAQQPNAIRLEEFKLLKAPKPHGLLLNQGDRLAICGD